MKRLSLLLMAVLVLALALTACGGSPKARARELIKYLPEEIGEWELDDQTELLTSTITSEGHIILEYEGPDDAIAYIDIVAHPADDAADVALVERERELLLDGLALEITQAARLAQTDRVRYALMKQDDITVEIDTLSAKDEDPVSDEDFEALVDAVHAALDMVAEG